MMECLSLGTDLVYLAQHQMPRGGLFNCHFLCEFIIVLFQCCFFPQKSASPRACRDCFEPGRSNAGQLCEEGTQGQGRRKLETGKDGALETTDQTPKNATVTTPQPERRLSPQPHDRVPLSGGAWGSETAAWQCKWGWCLLPQLSLSPHFLSPAYPYQATVSKSS